MAKKTEHRYRYLGELNRPRWDNMNACIRRLQRAGLDVEKLRHKTAFAVIRPSSMSWTSFLNILRTVLDPKLGSMLLFSQHTGNAFRCDNRGNRPGRFLFA